MKGGAPRAVWMTVGADPQQISAYSTAQRLRQLGRSPHLVWNPVTGETVQLVPIVRAACSLSACSDMDTERPIADLFTVDPLAAEPVSVSTSVHTEGRLCVQIGVVGFGWAPFTTGPMNGLEAIITWLCTWGIAPRWPAGRPVPFAHAHTVRRSRKLWAAGGHFGGSQVPCCSVAGPGAIDIERMLGAMSVHAADLPLPRPGGAPQLQRPARVSRMDHVSRPDEADQATQTNRVGGVLAEEELARVG
jgi:hypothetical protein